MMDLGIDEPGAFERLVETLHIIDACSDRVTRLPTDPALLGNPGTNLHRWITEELPDPTVDPRLTIFSALETTLQCLAQIRRFCLDPEPSTTPVVIATLMRSSLLSGARPIFMLGSLNPEQQKNNILRVMRQESDSLFRHYNKSSNYVHLTNLIPPEEILIPQKERHARIVSLTKSLSETAMISEAVEIVANRISEYSGTPSTAGVLEYQQPLAEQLMWIFNAYSGKAHGYGWPRLTLHQRDLPGDFVADLTALVTLTGMAIHVTEEAHFGHIVDYRSED